MVPAGTSRTNCTKPRISHCTLRRLFTDTMRITIARVAATIVHIHMKNRTTDIANTMTASTIMNTPMIGMKDF